MTTKKCNLSRLKEVVHLDTVNLFQLTDEDGSIIILNSGEAKNLSRFILENI